VNGVVDYSPGACTACHGSGDDPAPPVDTLGNTDRSFKGVGAHQAHLKDNPIGRPLACSECHPVPNKVDAPGHVDGLPADVVLASVATSGGHDKARYDFSTRTCANTWCHGAGTTGHGASPDWTSSEGVTCASCHGDPPAPPHPQMTECSRCHGAVVGSDDRTIVDPLRHVDGQVDVAVPESCTACHGGVNPAPPVDTAGNASTTARGVGAHQTHVAGTASSRPVPCNECHVVPVAVLDPGHIDTARPAEVTFSKTALAFGAAPAYVDGTCGNTSCHGAVFPNGDDSGGSNTTPTWTRVGGVEAACGSCHSLPPPAPHPYASLNPVCNKCHKDIAPDNVTFLHPELHVDGAVTFEVP
jgi:predicted CxxxxCH...CXXCH cytochrome family protein